MRTLGQPNQQWAGDTGVADPAVRAALAAATDRDGYLDAVAALGGARLLLPIVAEGEEFDPAHRVDVPDPDKQAEMAAVRISHPDLGEALLVFTGLDSLQAWNPGARPVPCTLDTAAASVAETGSTVLLVDAAGPAPLVVGADLVTQLAQGRRLVRLEDGGFGWMFAPGSGRGEDAAAAPHQE